MDNSPAAPSRIVFSSDQLGEDLGDNARFLRWREIYTSLYGDAEIARIEDRPFSSHAEFMQIGEIGIAQCAGTFGRYARTRRHVAADTRGDFFIGFLRGQSRMALAQHGRELTLQPGEFAFYSNAEAYANTPDGPSVSAALCIPRALLLERIGNARGRTSLKPLDAVATRRTAICAATWIFCLRATRSRPIRCLTKQVGTDAARSGGAGARRRRRRWPRWRRHGACAPRDGSRSWRKSAAGLVPTRRSRRKSSRRNLA